jgi:Skp family chaperone for outer membrane proteins
MGDKDMMKTLFAALVLVLSLSTVGRAAPAAHNGNPTGKNFAQKHPRRAQVNNRVKNQRNRINQGVKSGELTKGQAKQLRANDNAIKAQEHADVKANGGHLTGAEQKQLNQEENANSALIHDEKHPAGQ